MKQNLGVLAYGKGDVRLQELAEPVPAPHEAVVAIAYGGVCGSDLHYWQHGAAGESILRAPMLLGHEVVGTVAEAAADGSGPTVGTHVAVHPANPAPGTERYPAERPNLSPGCTYLGSAARFPHTDGAFARTVALPTNMLRPLPAGLALERAAVAEPAAVAWHAVARAGEVRGKRVLVVGSGPIGALSVAVLRRAGAAEIIAVDIHDKPLGIAAALGATRTLKAPSAEEAALIDADIVIESSGSHHGLATAVLGATRGGRVVMVGLLPTGPQPALISRAIVRELELVGSFRFNGEMDEVLQALADGSLVVEPVVTHILPVEKALEAFETAKDASVSGKVLLAF